MTEKEIQNFIWKNKDNFYELLSQPDLPEKIIHDNPWEYSPSEIVYNLILGNYLNTWSKIKELSLFGCEVPLKKDEDSTIRADFLGYLPGYNGLVVAELKKSAQTERQAFTELLAYGGHLRTIFAPMSKLDIVYLLISPMHERIVREAAINTIIYDRNIIFALIPTYQNDDVKTLRLEPWIPTFNDVKNLVEANFSQSNFDIFKVVWEGLPGVWSPKKKGDNPDSEMIRRLNTVSAYAAQIMEANGIHGFVYASQNYSETRDSGHLINSLIIGGINPYNATKNRHYVTRKGVTAETADNMSTDSLSISDIITGLPKAKKQDPDFYILSSMASSWYGDIIKIGFDIVNTLTKSINGASVETSYGSFDWHSYQTMCNEDIYCHNYDMRTTGLIRELFFEYSINDYSYMKKNGFENHPQFYHGDIPEYLADISTSQHFVREFLLRLFNPLHSMDFCGFADINFDELDD